MAKAETREKINVFFNWVWLQIFILVVFVFYISLGTYMFIKMEHEAWWKGKDDGWEWRDKLVSDLWQFLKPQNVTRKLWRVEFLDQISGTLSAKDNFCSVCMWRDEELCENPWIFEKTISFCTGLCLTLGYGGMAPVSRIGIIVCVVYGVIGMALMVYILGSYGSVLNTLCTNAWTYVVRFYYTGIYWKSEDTVKKIERPLTLRMKKLVWFAGAAAISKGNQPVPWDAEITRQNMEEKIKEAEGDEFKADIPLGVALLCLLLYILFGEILINSEMALYGWDHVESTYYHINLFTTIGFVTLPLQDEVGVWYSHLYLFGGFLLLSMLFDIVQNMIAKTKTVLQIKEKE